MRPGMYRLYASLVAKYAACGPPKPIGIPSRWVLPKTTSAPQTPGASSKVNATKSAATASLTPADSQDAAKAVMSFTEPVAVGYCRMAA